MIAPKVSERMLRLNLSCWVIRFWFEEPYDVALELAQEQLLVEIRAQLFHKRGTARDIAREIELIATPDHKLSALEVLSASTHNGTVRYYEWP